MAKGVSNSDTACFQVAIPHHLLRVVAPPPDTVTQRNVETVTGVPARVFLESIRDPAFPLPVARLGRLRIVNRAAFVAWLERGAFEAGTAASIPEAAQNVDGSDATREATADKSEDAGDIIDALGMQGASEPARRRRRR